MGTKFEEWCRVNEIDPKGKFIVVDECELLNGQIVKLQCDTNQEMARFVSEEGDSRLIRFKRNLEPIQIEKHNVEPIQFDPHTFDFRQVLPKCWVRNKGVEWCSAFYLRFLGKGYSHPFSVMTELGLCFQYEFCIFEEPESREARVKARADELRAELERIEKELSE